MSKTAIVFGAGGFIGYHVSKRLKNDGYYVRGVDLKYPEFDRSPCDEFFIGDCRVSSIVEKIIDRQYDRVFQLAADMGGAAFISTGNNDADIMHNNAKINLNVVETSRIRGINQVFYSSSACVYNEYNQLDPNNPDCREDSAYPAHPDTEYGWEKLFSERLYLSYNRQYNMNNRVARFHNIFGEFGTWRGGREKAPAAICRKIAEAVDGESIEVWGDGNQSRSFLHVDECVEGIMRLMDGNFSGPINIGSEELITVNDFTKLVCKIAGKNLEIVHTNGPQGVRGRNSNNDLIREKLNWSPSTHLQDGLEKTYKWIEQQVRLQGIKE